jgi:hypothetical protein
MTDVLLICVSVKFGRGVTSDAMESSDLEGIINIAQLYFSQLYFFFLLKQYTAID